MRTARFISSGGGDPLNPPGCRPFVEADPLDAGHVTCDACWEDTPMDTMTDTCKNITFPQTLFASGNNFSVKLKLNLKCTKIRF